jgi:hypothetical protein
MVTDKYDIGTRARDLLLYSHINSLGKQLIQYFRDDNPIHERNIKPKKIVFKPTRLLVERYLRSGLVKISRKVMSMHVSIECEGAYIREYSYLMEDPVHLFYANIKKGDVLCIEDCYYICRNKVFDTDHKHLFIKVTKRNVENPRDTETWKDIDPEKELGSGAKELTNQEAKADLVLYDEDTDGTTVLVEQVSVTLLLEYEKFFKQQLEYYKSIPTLDMNKSWQRGFNAEGKNCYVTNESKSIRKVNKVKTTSFDPNPSQGEKDKFPLQPMQVKEEVAVGEYTTVTKSGCISPAEKAELCERCEKLLSAVKVARARANEIVVTHFDYGKKLIDYLNGKTD